MLSLMKIARKLRSWDHVKKFTLGNVELELAVSTLVLEAIALGRNEALSAGSRENGLAEGIATRSDVAISNHENRET